MRVAGKPTAWDATPPGRRTAPPDRRSPQAVVQGGCPLARGCYCCPSSRTRGHDKCSKPHPAVDKTCSPPYPANIPECAERRTDEQFLPYPPPPGFRNPPTPVCTECGRITHREWTDPEGRVLPWCAGELTKPNAI